MPLQIQFILLKKYSEIIAGQIVNCDKCKKDDILW